MKVYKLTDQKFLTRNNTLWGENVTHETSGKGNLCGVGWLHYYHHPILAILLNPVYGNIPNPILWEAKAEGKQLNDNGLKGGCTRLTTIKQLPLPEITLEQRIEFGIRCVMKVCKNEKWLTWAEKWLSGEDRFERSAYAAVYAVYADAAYAAAYAVANAVAYANTNANANANAAVYAANAIAYAATENNFDAILKEVFG